MAAKTIAKRLRDDLDLNFHPSTIQKARHQILNYNYRRSKCKPKEDYNEREKNARLLFALNNRDNDFRNTVFVDESSVWCLRGGLYHHRKKGKNPKCNTSEPRNVEKVHVWTGISWDGAIVPVVYFLTITVIP
jgi:hypothetical protein